MSSEGRIADRVSVAVPVALDRAFTYAVPEGMCKPAPGCRVLVPLGPRTLVGVVRPEPPDDDVAPDKLRPILEDLDGDAPALPEPLLRLCEWVADYYVAPIGEAYRLALPGLLTHADARVARLTETGRDVLGAGGPLLAGGPMPTGPQRRVLDAIAAAPGSGLPVSKLSRLRPRVAGVLAVLSQCESAGWCETEWSDPEGEGPRTESHFRRTELLRGTGAVEDKIKELVGRSKQRRAILDLLESRADEDDGWIPMSELRAPFPRARVLLPPLVQANLVATCERPLRTDPFEGGASAPATPQTPTEEQAVALATLTEALERGGFCSALLEGVTGSGKTEVYLQLIAEARRRGQGAIVLVPEIALTPQLAERFAARFGEQVAVLHSGLTPRQRLDAWQLIARGDRPIVIGARSAIFAPVANLGVVVVDEEHDGSFKQEEGVRYHARDVALVRAQRSGGLVVLGSATPSLETYARAQQGKHEWLRLTTRPTPRPLPDVELVPLSVHRPDPESLLTARMIEALDRTVAAGEQAILFLNRRGFTTSLVCTDCGSMQRCPDCSAPSMTYHLSRGRLMCHLCGHIEAAPKTCRDCGSEALEHGGVGTERVEVALANALPGVRVLRLDRDAARGRRLLSTLARFRRGEADVLVGTQMLSKGHDFPGVTLVGILQGDHGLALPDPRAAERTFQLLTQVAGRAGRGERPGRVLVQAWAVTHPAIVHAARHDFAGFAAEELARRQQLANPPHGHLALVRVSGLDAAQVRARVNTLARFVHGAAKIVAERHPTDDPEAPPMLAALGPVPSPIERINRRTRHQILLRARERGPLRWLLSELRPHLGHEGTGARQTQAMVDVDPQSLL